MVAAEAAWDKMATVDAECAVLHGHDVVSGHSSVEEVEEEVEEVEVVVGHSSVDDVEVVVSLHLSHSSVEDVVVVVSLHLSQSSSEDVVVVETPGSYHDIVDGFPIRLLTVVGSLSALVVVSTSSSVHEVEVDVEDVVCVVLVVLVVHVSSVTVCSQQVSFRLVVLVCSQQVFSVVVPVNSSELESSSPLSSLGY